MGTSGDYDEVIIGSGSLKLKGSDSSNKKKKKKSSSSVKEQERLKSDLSIDPITLNHHTQLLQQKSNPSSSSTSFLTNNSSTNPSSIKISRIEKTEAEKRFEQVQKKRLTEKAQKQALKTHKDRVAAFNERLEAQSEHFDIPKVGPG